MRKVLFTEAQITKIMGEGILPYLSDAGNAADMPDNAYGTDIAVNNMDKDANPDVTTTDNFLKKRSNIRYGYLAGTRRNFEESIQEDLDNEKVQGFGKNSDEFIANAAQNGGKMISNVANRIQNGGQRLNTTEVELSRMKDAKKLDPVTYAKNGGDKMVKILKNTANRQRNSAASLRDANANSQIDTPLPTPNVNKGTGKGHSTPKVYYENY